MLEIFFHIDSQRISTIIKKLHELTGINFVLKHFKVTSLFTELTEVCLLPEIESLTDEALFKLNELARLAIIVIVEPNERLLKSKLIVYQCDFERLSLVKRLTLSWNDNNNNNNNNIQSENVKEFICAQHFFKGALVDNVFEGTTAKPLARLEFFRSLDTLTVDRNLTILSLMRCYDPDAPEQNYLEEVLKNLQVLLEIAFRPYYKEHAFSSSIDLRTEPTATAKLKVALARLRGMAAMGAIEYEVKELSNDRKVLIIQEIDALYLATACRHMQSNKSNPCGITRGKCDTIVALLQQAYPDNKVVADLAFFDGEESHSMRFPHLRTTQFHPRGHWSDVGVILDLEKKKFIAHCFKEDTVEQEEMVGYKRVRVISSDCQSRQIIVSIENYEGLRDYLNLLLTKKSSITLIESSTYYHANAKRDPDDHANNNNLYADTSKGQGNAPVFYNK